MPYRITILPQQWNIDAAPGENLMQVLRRAGLPLNAPCGGEGRCGKCTVLADGREILACRTAVTADMTVTLPPRQAQKILTDGLPDLPAGEQGHYALAFDIGTTTVVGYLMEGSRALASAGAENPQTAFGADVVTRIRHAMQGRQPRLTEMIRQCLRGLTLRLCLDAAVQPEQVQTVSVVGNPAMQQLLLGISVENLAKVPFSPVLREAAVIPAGEVLPLCENASLLIVPNIAGFVGADMVGCILATGMDAAEEMTLLVDIGTNGEMALGNRERIMACAAAAGPALEGAGIQWGMRGQAGAIDHVWTENGQLRYSVIGGGEAVGICGSGLIDAVAAALELGLLNERGRILAEDRLIRLTSRICLTQEDIRQVQLAKGAIAAGIELMARRMGIALKEIRRVYLAGAFGTYMNPKSACRMGLLPAELENRITAVGNAAGSGAKLLACSPAARIRAAGIASGTEALELSLLPEFPRCFARNMRF